MHIYKKTFKPKNTAGKITALLLLLCGAALFILAGMTLKEFYSVVQFIGVILIAVAVYIAAVYLLREYTFSIAQGERFNDEDALYAEKFDFIITERKNNRDIKVCHFSMSDLTDARVVEPKNKKQVRSERKGARCFTYNTLFAASRLIEIKAVLDGESYSILVSYDEHLLRALRDFIERKTDD